MTPRDGERRPVFVWERGGERRPGRLRAPRTVRFRWVALGAAVAAGVGGAVYGLDALVDRPPHHDAAASFAGAPATTTTTKAPTLTPLPARTPTPTPTTATATTTAAPPAANDAAAPPSAPATTAGRAAAPSGPSPAAYWPLNDGSGGVALDRTGGQDATATDVGWSTDHGGAAVLNGGDSLLATSGPVLDTGPGSSFTVAAWVYLNAIPANGYFATAVSQDGTYGSGFYLQYDATAGRWAFTRMRADATNYPEASYALSSGPPAVRAWTHLVGVFDASDNEMSLYVDGTLQGTAVEPSPYTTNGSFVIGRGQYVGKDVDYFPGEISDVRAYAVALTPAQAAAVG